MNSHLLSQVQLLVIIYVHMLKRFSSSHPLPRHLYQYISFLLYEASTVMFWGLGSDKLWLSHSVMTYTMCPVNGGFLPPQGMSYVCYLTSCNLFYLKLIRSREAEDYSLVSQHCINPVFYDKFSYINISYRLRTCKNWFPLVTRITSLLQAVNKGKAWLFCTVLSVKALNPSWNINAQSHKG